MGQPELPSGSVESPREALRRRMLGVTAIGGGAVIGGFAASALTGYESLECIGVGLSVIGSCFSSMGLWLQHKYRSNHQLPSQQTAALDQALPPDEAVLRATEIIINQAFANRHEY